MFWFSNKRGEDQAGILPQSPHQLKTGPFTNKAWFEVVKSFNRGLVSVLLDYCEQEQVVVRFTFKTIIKSIFYPFVPIIVKDDYWLSKINLSSWTIPRRFSNVPGRLGSLLFPDWWIRHRLRNFNVLGFWRRLGLHKLVFTRPPLQEGSSIQVEILFVCLFFCLSVLTSVIALRFPIQAQSCIMSIFLHRSFLSN